LLEGPFKLGSGALWKSAGCVGDALLQCALLPNSYCSDLEEDTSVDLSPGALCYGIWEGCGITCTLCSFLCVWYIVLLLHT
jgi:hypothetical protein